MSIHRNSRHKLVGRQALIQNSNVCAAMTWRQQRQENKANKKCLDVFRVEVSRSILRTHKRLWKKEPFFYLVFLFLFGAGLPSEGDWPYIIHSPVIRDPSDVLENKKWHALRLFGCACVGSFTFLSVFDDLFTLMGLGRKTWSAREITQWVEMTRCVFFVQVNLALLPEFPLCQDHASDRSKDDAELDDSEEA